MGAVRPSRGRIVGRGHNIPSLEQLLKPLDLAVDIARQGRSAVRHDPARRMRPGDHGAGAGRRRLAWHNHDAGDGDWLALQAGGAVHDPIGTGTCWRSWHGFLADQGPGAATKLGWGHVVKRCLAIGCSPGERQRCKGQHAFQDEVTQPFPIHVHDRTLRNPSRTTVERTPHR
jgi:hypothetical protein